MRTLLLAAGVLLLMLAGGCGSGRAPNDGALTQPTAPKAITTTSGIEMVFIPAGEFAMGDGSGARDERPTHRVRIGALYVDRCEVTQEAYERLVGRNPSKFVGAKRPVERASWHAAVRYCNLRSLSEGLRPCYDLDTLECDFTADGYRLPTEAEWEYACRAGTQTAYSFGEDPRALDEYAWFAGNATAATAPVGQKKPNAWGLYDMYGNVAEWCNDFYAEDAYLRTTAADPRGPSGGRERVLRGGSWRSSAEACRSATRASESPGFADVCFGYEAYGFRCVRRAP